MATPVTFAISWKDQVAHDGVATECHPYKLAKPKRIAQRREAVVCEHDSKSKDLENSNMKKAQTNRRNFIKGSVTTAASLSMMSALANENRADRSYGRAGSVSTDSTHQEAPREPRIRFSVIGINHDHINSQIGATIRGGGEFVSFYAKEPDLAAKFANRYPQAKLARNENEILEDNSVKLILSAAIPEDRAPLGILVMRHGKDYMSDKPGITTLEQLAPGAARAERNPTHLLDNV